MSKSELKQGDKVRTKDRGPGVIRQVNNSGSAALVDTGEDETFDTSWYSTDSLTKATAAKKAAAAPPATVPALPGRPPVLPPASV